MFLLRRAFKVFDVSGIPIRLHFSWIIVFALLATTLAELMPAELAKRAVALPASAEWTLAVATALGFFASILLHEFGHALVAMRNGVRIRGITLFIFGGVAELEREPDSPGVELRVAVAGPAVSLVLAALFFALEAAARAAPFDSQALRGWLARDARSVLGTVALAVAEALRFLAAANLTLIIFNLFPGFPLDGGRVLRSLIWRWTGSMRRATRVTTAIGGLFGAALIALALAEAIFWEAPLFHAVWLALIGLFVRRAARASYEHAVIQSGLAGLAVRDVMRETPLLPPAPAAEHAPEMRVTPATAALAALEAMRDRAYLLVFEGELFRGLVTRGDILRAAALRGAAS